MKRIGATIAVAALVVTASLLSGLIPSAGLLNGVWAGDEAKEAREQRDQNLSLDQVPPPVKAAIERESAGGQGNQHLPGHGAWRGRLRGEDREGRALQPLAATRLW